MTVAGIVLAAGSGERFGSRKQYALVDGVRLVDRAVTQLRDVCDHVVVVLPPGDVWSGPPVAAAVTGGATRAASVRAGLAAVPADAAVVVIHDAAHPLARRSLFEAVIAAVQAGADGATPALDATNTLGRPAPDAALDAVVQRSGVAALQMPHAFRAASLRHAHADQPDATDDVSLLVERGHRVVSVAGDPANIHVTTAAELDIATALAPLAVDVEMLRDRRVLVTGASGLIGHHLVPMLVEAGAEVHAVSRRPRAADGSESVTWHVADLTSEDAPGELLDTSGADLVVHLAGEVIGSRGLEAVMPTLEANLVASVRLLTAATLRSCHRVVLAGSFYQEPPPGDDPVPPAPYGASKFGLRGYARLFESSYGLPVVNLRPTMGYGPGQSDLTKVVPYATLALLRGESPALSSGSWDVDWIHAADIARAFLRALVVDRAVGTTLDVGSGQVATVRQVVEHLAEEVGGPGTPDFGARPDRPNENTLTPDLEETWRVLGWRARVGLVDGLRDTVAWYRAEGSRQRGT